MEKFIIDKNGKILDKIEDGDRLRILRKKSLNLLNKTFFLKIDFVKINYAELMLLRGSLTKNECLFLFVIMPFTGYMDNCIRYRNGVPLDFCEFMEISEMSRSSMYRTLTSLSKKMIVLKNRKKYYMNPWIANRGSRINKSLKILFGDYFILTKGKKWSDIKDEKE